jgi:hypothetical protein
MDPKKAGAAGQGLGAQQGQMGQQGQNLGQSHGQQTQRGPSDQDQQVLQERQQQAWDAAAEREKSNNPATKPQREYGKDAPGMDPANQPDPDTKLYKATRLDLEDITGNPGHRGVNPDAPANSINKDPNDSINEPRHIDQNWPQRGKQGKNEATGHENITQQGSVNSINEPPGSQVIPPGAGAGTGEEVEHPPGSIPGSEAKPEIEALDPDEIETGAADTVLHVHGSGFTESSVIHFAGQDEPTSFVSDSEITTGLKPSLWQEAVVVECKVKNGDQESEPVEFEFIEPDAPAASRQTKRTKPKPTGKKKR